MGFLLLAILLGIIAAICIFLAIFKPGVDYRNNIFVTGAVSGVLALVLIIWGSIMTVPTGHIAVMSRFGRLTGEVKSNGFSWKVIIDTPIIMTIQSQKNEVVAEAASKDLQDVSTTIATNYHIDSSKAVEIYRTMGNEYWNIFAAPAEQETVKAISATYNAEDMILRREEVKSRIAETLTSKLADRGIIVEAINITNFEFSQEFTAAIESKVVAAQEIEKAKNQLERIKVEADQAVAKAKGQADAEIALATGRAQANEIIQTSLTSEILQYFMLDQFGEDIKFMVIPSGQNLAITLPEQ
jgi:prohibitin 2